MRIYFLIIAFVSFTILSAQNYQTIEEINDACSVLGFSANEEAEIAVDNILNQIGLFRNFNIIECPDINNARATIITSASGVKERYILYDSQFFKNIDIKAGNNWAAISILAHEIGHHLNGHALIGLGSTPKIELEADEFSGFVLAKMGATLIEAQSAIQTLKYEKATSTHPAKIDRLDVIKKGWNKGKGASIEIVVEDKNKAEGLKLYRKGEQEYTNKNYREALHTFKSAKNFGNIDAYFYISSIYYNGMGVKIDYIKAYDYAKKGYELGSIPATYLYATFLADGFVVKQNKEDAQRLFKKDFQFKWFKNQYEKFKTPFIAANIGAMYFKGYGGVKMSDEIALDWFTKAEKKGDNLASYKLAIMYSNGFAVNQDYDEAIYLFRNVAEEGFASAQNNLGAMYQEGQGVQKNIEKAIFWYQKGAKQEEALSIYNLGLIYHSGNGVEKDFTKAAFWYHKVAKLPGHFSAQHNLAILYKKGLGVEKDYDEAFYWFSKAAENDYVESQTNLGDMYRKGLGVEQDYQKAFIWIKKAAEQDYDGAQNKLGFMYESGYGVEKDAEQAFFWYQKAAKQGNEYSQASLGYLYYKGIGVDEDYNKAIYWLQLSARQNNNKAQEALTGLGETW